MWIRNDDQFIHHGKFARAAELLGGPHAFARVVCAFGAGQCYANHHVTNGFLSDGVVRGFAQFVDDPEAVARALVECRLRDGGAGLWERVQGGYVIHDYEQYLPPAALQEQVRQARAEAGRKGGQRSGETRRRRRHAHEAPPQANPEANAEATAEAKPPQVIDAPTVHEANEANGQAKTNPVPGTRSLASPQNGEAGGGPRIAFRGRGALIGGPDPRIYRYGRVEVWRTLHEGFRRRLGIDDLAAADRRLDAFYAEVEARWDATGEVPVGRPFEVWQREFDRVFARSGYRRAGVTSTARPGATSPRWEALCDRLEATGAIRRDQRFAWLAPCRVLEDTGQVLRVTTSAAGVQWIRKFYGEALDEAIRELAPDCRLELVAEVDEAAMPAAAGAES